MVAKEQALAESGKRADRNQAEAKQTAGRLADLEKQVAADKAAAAAKTQELEKQRSEQAKAAANAWKEADQLRNRLADKEKELEQAAEKNRQLQEALAAVNAALNNAGGAK